MTWITCADEIRRCFEESGACFFISLQGDKYGYLPLPKYIDQAVLDRRLESLIKQMNDLSIAQGASDVDTDGLIHDDKIEELSRLIVLTKEWYSLDENSIPPRYELKRLNSLSDQTYYSTVLPNLREKVLNDIAFEEQSQSSPQLQHPHLSSRNLESIMINRSITEWETLFALNLDSARCYWISRKFDKSELKGLMTNALTLSYPLPSATALPIATAQSKEGHLKQESNKPNTKPQIQENKQGAGHQNHNYHYHHHHHNHHNLL
jgi:hypothetical protein